MRGKDVRKMAQNHDRKWSHLPVRLTMNKLPEAISSTINSPDERIIHGRLNASWKICSLVVNRQSFLVIDGYLLNLF
jgi:hypothetical protein